MEENTKNNIEDEVNLQQEWHRLVSNIIEYEKKESKKKSVSASSFFKYAAILIFIISLPLGTLVISKTKDSVNEINICRVITDKGEKSYIELEDGTRIWINAHTTIEYDNAYNQTNRTIFLEGEAYFEVASHQTLPFIVKTNNMEVMALGTSFDVSAYPEDLKVITTLFSGKVSVHPVSINQQIILEANQIAIYHKEEKSVLTQLFQNTSLPAWREGVLSFDMISLKEIAKQLERNYNVTINFENSNIQDILFKGNFHSGESITDILDIIKINSGISYTMNNNIINIQ